MTLNVIPNTTAVSLPTVYNAHGYTFNLYGGLVRQPVLSHLGRQNTAQASEDYTYEVRVGGVAQDSTDLAALGFEISTVAGISGSYTLKALDSEDELVEVLADSALANVTIYVHSATDADSWESDAFTWNFSASAPPIASLSTPRNWNAALNPNWELAHYLCAAEDCDGRYAGGHDSSVKTGQPLHHIPIRRGGAFSGVPISSVNSPSSLYASKNDGTILFSPEGYLPLQHFTTSDLVLISGEQTVFGDSDDDAYIVHVMDDWKSEWNDGTENLPHQQNTADGYSAFFNFRLYDPVRAVTFLCQLQMDDGSFKLQMNDGSSEFGTGFLELWDDAVAVGGETILSTASGDYSAAGNSSLTFNETDGAKNYLIIKLHAGAFDTPTGTFTTQGHKISVWMQGNSPSDFSTPYDFFIPLHANNDNSAGIRLASAASYNVNWYSSSVLKVSSAISEQVRHEILMGFVASQQSLLKNFPISLLRRVDTMIDISFPWVISNGSGTTDNTGRIKANFDVNSGYSLGFGPPATFRNSDGAPFLDMRGIQESNGTLRVFLANAVHSAGAAVTFDEIIIGKYSLPKETMLASDFGVVQSSSAINYAQSASIYGFSYQLASTKPKIVTSGVGGVSNLYTFVLDNTAGEPVSITGGSQTSDFVTLNVAAHEYVVGQMILVAGVTGFGTDPNGEHEISAVNDTSIIYALSGTPDAAFDVAGTIDLIPYQAGDVVFVSEQLIEAMMTGSGANTGSGLFNVASATATTVVVSHDRTTASANITNPGVGSAINMAIEVRVKATDPAAASGGGVSNKIIGKNKIIA